MDSVRSRRDESGPHVEAGGDGPPVRIEPSYGTCEPVAVIGLACRFPGAPDSDAYWRNLVAGVESSRHFTREELGATGVPLAVADRADYVNVAAVIDDVEAFDAPLFGYARQEAEILDPQQRLFLQIAWHALEHAGYAPRHVPHKTGVFGAARLSTYPGRDRMALGVSTASGLQALLGNDKDYLATRVAYKLNLKGPALTVQTACSSSLVAVHMACESLRSGECDMALAGGAAVSFPTEVGYLHQPGMIFSPDGRCRPFDAGAQGTYGGHGVGAVALRRLDDALRDGDPILAVLRGSAINNDGSLKVGFTAPSVLGQREVVREAMLVADVTPADIGMIEAHGTATPLGDPIEVEALAAAFAERGTGPVWLGSVKGNFGHLDTAAGIASLIKAVLAVYHGTIPPSLGFTRPNPALKLERTPFAVPTRAQDWPQPVRTAGVSAFGLGGTNCHVVVQSAPLQPPAPAREPVAADGLLVSAATGEALRTLAAAYAAELRQGADPVQLASTACHGRERDLGHRLAVPVGADMAAALEAFAAGIDHPLAYAGQGPARALWLFGGQGTQWEGMGEELYRTSTAFARGLDLCCDLLAPHLDLPLRDVMAGRHPGALADMRYTQPAVVAFQIAMAAFWHDLGLAPDLVLGHSVGEYAAAVVAGILPAEIAMPLVAERGRLMQAHAANGAMLTAFADEDTLRPLLDRADLDVAAYNDAGHLVLSGRATDIRSLADALDAHGVRHNLLAVEGAAHSALLDPMLDVFEQAAARVEAARPAAISPTYLSGLLGREVDVADLCTRSYWRRHVREPVRFGQALRCAIEGGATFGLELGAEAPLSGIGRRAYPGSRWIASARRQPSSAECLQAAYLQLYAAGADLPWQRIWLGRAPRCRAPLYPFSTERFTCSPAPAATDTPPATADAGGALGAGRAVAVRAGETLDLPRLAALYACVVPLHAIYVDAMVRACVGDRIEAGVSAVEILRGGRLLPRYWQLLVRLLNACVQDGYYRRDGELFSAVRPIPHEARARLTEELRGYCEGLDVIADTVTSAGTQLHAMMRGAVEPVGVIFPASASQGVEVLYQDFSFGRYFNQIAAGVVAGLARDHSEPHFDVLEVGGGTGGTTAWLLPELTHRPGVRYDFTDISPIFTRRAADKFAAYDFVAYREFDLQRDAQGQSFAPAGYDLIVAANVIHATQHVGRTLRALRGLLKPGGHLVMREITRPMRLFDFVFGPLVAPLLDLPDRGGELFLDTARWEAACRGAGFSTVAWLPDDGTATARISEHVIVAGTAAASGRVGRVGRESGHPVLGRIVGSGAYLADWSDGLDDAAWQDRLRQAAEELTRRHGAGADVPAWPAKLERPPGSGEIRLTWRPGLFGKAHIDIETARAGDWQLVARAGPTARLATAPLPTPAPGTTYRWRWRWRPVATSRSATAWRPVGADAETRRAWDAAGIVLDADAEARLIVPSGDRLAERATAVLRALGSSPRRAVLLTRGAWHAGSAIDPAERALWGLLRVAATEHPGAEIGAIDLASDAGADDLAVGLAAIEAGERWVAVHGGIAQAQELAVDPGAQPGMPPDGLRTVRWHVVTGGFGGLGRASVAWLVRLGAERVAILAPRADEGALAWRADLERAAGATIRWLACDVASPDALVSALRTLEAEGGIAGILHAAGTLDDAPLADLSVPRLERVLSVKADAAEIFVAHLERERREGYLVLYSSAAAALGARGQGAHALASGHLDGLAERARASGLAVVSVAWGAWGEVGRASTPTLRERLAAEGMGVLTTGEGLWHLEQALLGARAYRLAMRVDLPETDGRRRLLAQAPRPQAAPPAPDRVMPVARTASPAQPLAPDLTGDGETDAQLLRDWLARRIRAQLRLDASVAIGADQDLLRLGLDSLLFLELSAEVERALGVRLNAGRAYGAMTVAGLTALILSERAPSETPSRAEPAEPAAMASTDARARFEPFPLTPIQHAYWLGRTDVIDFGGIACHVVFEWDKTVADCDPDALERAWNAVVQRHDMLRATIGEDGFQSVAAQVPDYRFTRSDLRGLPPAEAEERLGATRERLSRDVTPAERWPLFEVVVSRRDEARYRLHMKLDLLLFDVQSFKVLFDDLATAYSGQALAPLDFTFRDYVLHQLAARERKPWRAAWRYWLDRIETLPPAPQLALAEGEPASRPRVTTRQGRLPEPVWTRLKAGWQAWGVTPSAALLTLFAIVLERACRRPDFTLNLTFFNRRPVHPDVPQLIGDFTSVLLVEFEPGSGESLRERMEATQARLWRHLANSDVNGVDVLRELGRRHGIGGRPLMPVVFTSMLGMTLDGMSIDRAMTRLLGEPVCVLTQTPQVWIDHQVMEEDGGLLFHWYCMDAVLAPGLADALFRDYERLLDALASGPDSVELPALLPARRAHPEAAGPGLDWRDLEAVLGTYPGIDGALIEAREDGPAVAWLSIDPHHDAPARPRSIDIDTASLPVLDAGQRAEVEAVWQVLEARSLHGIWATLQRHGLFAAEGQRATHREVCERVGATATTERLLRQWLDHLCTRRLLRHEDMSYVRTDMPRPERSAFPDDGPDWGRALFRFTDRSTEAHDALLRGERSALEIFFDAEAGGEQALYRAHPVPDCLSRAAAEIFRQLAQGRNGLAVLEVGAGTGATTRAVLPAIRGALAQYVFTDISTLFLDDARKLFPDEPALRLAILDINAAPDFSAHPEGGYDILLAVNVLHDATDVVRSLRRLRRLLSPDGVLLVVEATERDSAFQLATVGFIEGLNAFDDFRVEDGKAMLDVGQWRRVLDESGYALHLTWPPQAQGDWRQTLFVATPRASARPSLAGLADHLRATWPGPLPALAPRLCERLPRPSAGRPTSERPAVAPDLPACLRRADVERVVSEVWAGLLSRPIDATSDFFASGGDSLVATRMIAMLKGRGFPQASLRHAFEHPRLAAFCAAMAAAEPERDDRLQTLSTGGGSVEVFAFHGSDGGVEPYLSLARALDCTVHGLAAGPSVSAPSLALLVRRYVAAIRRRRPEGPYHLLGWSYGAFLAAEAAAVLHADGQTVRLVLLDPVSRADFRYEDRAGLLRLLCEGRTRVALPTDFDSLPAQSQFDVFLERAKSAGAWPELPDPADTERAIARIDALLGLLGTASSAAVRVPCLWLSAVRRPAHWRLAAEEWGERLPLATRQDIDADHWQLVLDRETCARVAECWQRWRVEQRESNT